MSIQTNVLENGEWVTRTLTTDELMRGDGISRRRIGRQPPSKPPMCGLLTRTIMDSPVVHWTLPIKIRPSNQNDIALIGENFVQICELRQDRRLQDIVRKRDFGSKIRNARVMGPSTDYATYHEDSEGGAPVKSEGDEDIEMVENNPSNTAKRNRTSRLPHNLLILALENGTLVFLYLQQHPVGNWEFVSFQHSIPGARLVYPGFHMTIDPSSRYLTLACLEDLFVTFELESMENLRTQHSRGYRLQPIKSFRARAISGVIHKIEYLHPSPENDYHIILLVLVVKHKKSKLVLYEWEQGDELRKVFVEERGGHPLADEYRLPLLLIPLTVRNAFLIVTERLTATCSDILQGSPTFEPFELDQKVQSTEYHDGSVKPLWTAWTRPYRESRYHTDHDVLYLAREDGLLNWLDIGEDPAVEVAYSMGSLECTIDSAFTCMYDTIGDVLIAGGNCCPGTIWSVEPRRKLERVGAISNWSPTIDITIVCESRRESEEPPRDNSNTALLDRRRTTFRRPDKVFVSSGRGKLGSITELRYGLPARITQVAEYIAPIRQCWAVRPLHDETEDGFLLLLSLPDRSAIIHFSEDFEDVIDREEDTVPYDLLSRTVAARDSDDMVVQVTTSFVIIVASTETSRESSYEITGDSTATIAYAVIQDDFIALAVHSQSGFDIYVLAVDGIKLSKKATYKVNGEVTCIALGQLAGQVSVFVGTLEAQSVILTIHAVNGSKSTAAIPESIQFNPDANGANTDRQGILVEAEPVEALTSIALVHENPQSTTLAVGTRSGHVFTLQIRADKYEMYPLNFGSSPAQVIPINLNGEQSSIMICNGVELTMMTNYSADCQLGRFEKIHRVWLADPNDPTVPSVNSVARIYRQSQEEVGVMNLAMISGNRILFSQLQRQPLPVPRHFPVGGAPTQILYADRLESLVTIVSKNGIPSLHFFDPETGQDLSRPVKEVRDEKGERRPVDIDYIEFLGVPSTRILCLSNWRYQHSGRTWEWIVVAGKVRDEEGLLLVVSAEVERCQTAEGNLRRIRFGNKFKWTVDAPVWSVTTDDTGVFICFGLNIHYLQVNPADKKLKMVKEFELHSPAAWMQVVDGRLHVVTVKHSLMILDYKGSSSIGENQMALLHSDPVARQGMHSIEAGSFFEKERERFRTITMLSDYSSGVYGLWSTSLDDEPLKLVFQAELDASVRRFVRGHTRPPWELATRKPRFGCIQSGRDTADILGISLDGSLRHFALLKKEAWQFLRFVQNLAMASPTICPHTYSNAFHGNFDPEPRSSTKLNMQVDGDILQRCLDERILEDIICDPDHTSRFRELLQALEENKDTGAPATQTSNDNMDHIKLAYEILEYYLAPVL